MDRDSLVTQMVKSLPAMRETQVWSLGQEDPLEKEMATHSRILAWKNPMDGAAWQATVHGVTKIRTWLRDFTFTFVDGHLGYLHIKAIINSAAMTLGWIY